jgi:hypothetical protein
MQDGDARVRSLRVKRTGRPAPAETAGGRAFGARQRGLEPAASTQPRNRQFGRTPQAARRVRNRRPTPEVRNSEAFAETDSSPRQLRHKLAAFTELPEQKGRRRYSKGGVGERLWSWGRKPAIRDARESAHSINLGGPWSQPGVSAFGVLGAKPERQDEQENAKNDCVRAEPPGQHQRAD